MTARLKTLLIENFRSIRGSVVIPLDAQVVLIHGTNGMGKTSVLSALELALTGRVAHLAIQGETYKDYLVNLGQSSGSIRLTTSQPLATDPNTTGDVSFTSQTFGTTPLLTDATAHFFSERYYLPQATLGRLLEIYNERTTSTNSPLTQFVKELLGLDPLDALTDGLHSAFHVARIRNLLPEYRRIEGLQGSTTKEVERTAQAITAARTKAETDKANCLALLSGMNLPPEALATVEQVVALRDGLNSNQTERDGLATLERRRTELQAATTAWRALPSGDAERDQATKDQEVHTLVEALTRWRTASGAALQVILDGLQPVFPELPALDDGPEIARSAALHRASGERDRCETLRQKAEQAQQRRQGLQQTIERSNARLGELDQALLASADATKSLAGALATIAPHIHGEQCPVCDRDFAESEVGPLSAHVANKIASLTTEAGRLQALAVERADVTTRLATTQRDLLAADRDILPPADLAQLTNRSSQMSAAVEALKPLEADALRGAALIKQAAAARTAAAAARRASELSTSVLPELDRIVTAILSAPLQSYDTVDVAVAEANTKLQSQISAAEAAISARTTTLRALDQYEASLGVVTDAAVAHTTALAEQACVTSALGDASTVRETAKSVSDAAERVRSAIVKRVFNTSLNRTWRDLFVRLAPSEDFVPKFRIPLGDKGKVDAVLETEHRSGQASGTPGAMLSQGNLNTAALTLFLALHLSVPQRMPWLVLDDPVQSMDDVHIAQFAALLRSLSKGAGRQIVVAVHEQALFDYLTLELSPAFPGDSLITVEISRGFDGMTIARSVPYSFEDDKVVAA